MPVFVIRTTLRTKLGELEPNSQDGRVRQRDATLTFTKSSKVAPAPPGIVARLAAAAMVKWPDDEQWVHELLPDSRVG